MPLQIIDTHIHIWDFGHAEYDWLRGDTSILNRNYYIEEIEQDRISAGVTAGILVQAANNFEDTNRMLFIASETNWIAGVVGWLPLTDPPAAEKALLGKYINNNYFKGVRHLIHNEVDTRWLLRDEVIESLRLLAAYGLPFDLVGIIPEHIETALKVAEKIPGLRMVFDHLNQPPISSKERFGRWGELMTEAAKHNNFYAKISGLGTASGDFTGWTNDDLKPSIEFALNLFGTDRCFCGGDWPVSLLAGSYAKHWQACTKILSSLLDDASLQAVLFKNAHRFYNLKLQT